MNELISSHQSGWNSSKAVMLLYLRSGVIYLGHAETLVFFFFFFVSVEAKQDTRRLGVFLGWESHNAEPRPPPPLIEVEAGVDAEWECWSSFPLNWLHVRRCSLGSKCCFPWLRSGIV